MFNELSKRIISSIILIPVILFLIIMGSVYFNSFLLICFFLTIFEWKKIIANKLIFVAGLIFIILSFLATYKIRYNFNNEYFIFLFISGICVATDIGGFVFGKLIKGPKLTKISPNKTYSGMIGSFLLTILFIFYFTKYVSQPYTYEFSLEVILFSVSVSAVSQFGDIIISYFKRVSKIKDTGTIIPGHGGILDRIDGMIFAFPFSFILFSTNYINFFQ